MLHSRPKGRGAQVAGGVTLGEPLRAYVARTGGREAYKRAMETCKSTKAFAAKAAKAAAR